MSAEERLEICKKCPIMKEDPIYGPICDSSKWINPKNPEEWSRFVHIGWKKGCGCHMKHKVYSVIAHCVAGKW